MRKPVVAATTLLLLAPLGLAVPVHAQGAERFRLERTEDGYLRMDTRTGAISLCRERSGELVCAIATDEREAYRTEIEELRERLTGLEARVEALEARPPEETAELPVDQEFERAIGLMERFFRSFVDIVRGLERDLEEGTSSEERAPAERT